MPESFQIVPLLFAAPGIETMQRPAFGMLNYLMLFVYLASMVAVGCWFSHRNKNTNDFFRGGQRVPWWAAGLSIYATMLSSITYMAIPAKAYATDWSYFFNALSIPLIAPIVVFLYLPFYRRLDVTSAYEYLEKRFNLAVRWFGSVSFILFQIGRMSIVLYLPALALATVSSLDIYFCILLMSFLCIIYTMVGGIEAVIWTEVIQAVVLLLGVMLAIVLIIAQTDGGAAGFFQTAHAHAKFLENADWGWSTTQATVWVILVGSMFQCLTSFTASQDVVQRYMTTKDARLAARSIWTNAFLTIPGSALFFFVGTALFVYYKAHPGQVDPNMTQDAIFPLFIVQQMPAGVGGLVVAGIFAAAQSTLSGSLNSVSTCLVTDFYHRLKPAASDRHNLVLAKGITVGVGVAVTIVACVMARANIVSLWDSFLAIIGLTGGALAGLFALGIFTTRANGPGAFCGAVTSIVVLALVQYLTNVNFFYYSIIGVAVCFSVGWLSSWFFVGASKPLAGLTLRTLAK